MINEIFEGITLSNRVAEKQRCGPSRRLETSCLLLYIYIIAVNITDLSMVTGEHSFSTTEHQLIVI